MLEKAKAWVQKLEEAFTELSKKYDTSIEEIEDEFDQFWYDGGDCYDQGLWEIKVIEDFKEAYENLRQE